MPRLPGGTPAMPPSPPAAGGPRIEQPARLDIPVQAATTVAPPRPAPAPAPAPEPPTTNGHSNGNGNGAAVAPRLRTASLSVPQAPVAEPPPPSPPPQATDARDGQTAYLFYDQDALTYAPQAHPFALDERQPHDLADTSAAPWSEPRPFEPWPSPERHAVTQPAPAREEAPRQEPGSRGSVRRARYAPAPARHAQGHTAALLVHLSGVLTGCLLPALFYLLARRSMSFTRSHSAEAVNFQLTLMLGYVGAAIVAVLFTGYLILVPIWLIGLVFCIQAAMAAEAGAEYHYPFTVRFVA